MNGNQIFVGCFGLFSLAVSAWALWCVARSRLPYKPAWMLGCLFGFVGFGLVWTKADHLVLLLGIEIPPVNVFTIAATGDQIVKTGFPVVAVVALAKSRSAPTPTEPLPSTTSSPSLFRSIRTTARSVPLWIALLLAEAWLLFTAADFVVRF